jgi:hypothetical protein
MQGAFVGYIQSVAVPNDCRGRGVGTALIEFAERRVLRETPNVFICVSSFSPDARRLCERLGYTVPGELTDYIIRGQSESCSRPRARSPVWGRMRESHVSQIRWLASRSPRQMVIADERGGQPP